MGTKLKRLGVKPGVFDLFFARPNKKFHGLWIEMKRKKGAFISTHQATWRHLMESQGYVAKYAYGFDEARQIILDYIDNKLELS